VWDEAARHFDADDLAHLLFAIGAINLWNRVVIAARTPPAGYERPAAA
jgi:alkylhydroperoxidase family enzyme